MMKSSSFESPKPYIFAQYLNSIPALLKYVILAQSNPILYHTKLNGCISFWLAVYFNIEILKSLIILGYSFIPDLMILLFLQEIFDESTYKLDEDFLIGMFSNDGNKTYMAIGMNNLMVEEDYVTYEIKKFASFSMGFNGLCYSIVPNNVMLKPGTNFYFFIESSVQGDY